MRAALDIDPHFLAAHSLRDRILAAAPAATPLLIPPPKAPQLETLPLQTPPPVMSNVVGRRSYCSSSFTS